MFKRKIITKEPENFEKAYEYAVYLLSLSLRTSGELENKMREKGYSSENIGKVIQELATNRYVDDSRYAEVYLENLKKYKTFGFYGIKKKLMEKRLPSSIIESVLSEGLSEEEEARIAKKFMLKAGCHRESLARVPKIPCDSSGNGRQEKQKFAQKLKSRGFRGSVIAKLIF